VSIPGIVVGRVSAILLAVAATCGGRPATAQVVDSTDLEISVGIGTVRGGTWDGHWAPGPAGHFDLATRYGPGLFRLGLSAYASDAIDEALPDFVAVHADAAWGPVVRLPAGLRAVPNAHVGWVALLFDDDDAAGPLRNESEITAGVAARVDAPLWGPARAWLGLDFARIFSRPSEDLLVVAVGVSVGLAAPAWLKRVSR
jgi:hypothetical protein